MDKKCLKIKTKTGEFATKMLKIGHKNWQILLIMLAGTLFCACAANDNFQVYHTIYYSTYAKQNPREIKLWYCGSTPTEDCFLLENSRLKLSKNHVEPGYPPFVEERERFEFAGWNSDKKRLLQWKIVECDGKFRAALKL